MADPVRMVRVTDTPHGTLVFVDPELGGLVPEQARLLADQLVFAARDAERQNEGCAA